LEVLQGTSAAKENKLEEEDEALLKSIVLHTSKDFVRRIKDEDFKEEEDLTRPSTSNDESMSNTLKQRKFSEKFSDKPTDSLMTATSSVPIVVIKKVASSLSIGLRSLLQNYGSGDDDDDWNMV